VAERAVAVREVGPRDGLQREDPLPVDRRIELITSLAACGFSDIEVAAFVSERAVPAMAGAAELAAGLPKGAGCTWWALVPNAVGAERATAAGIDHVTITVSASEGYSQRNVHMSSEDSSLQALSIIPSVGRADVVISCSFGSPYEDVIDPADVARLADRFRAAGASVTLADTTGVASPRRLGEVLALTGAEVGLHLHDTRGSALVNAYVAMELGVTRFDTSVGGLGGSPFADDAGGNLATEDLVALLDDLGTTTGVDLDRLLAVDETLAGLIGRPLPGRVAQGVRRAARS
jgi:hydroxymethylglutaryl-CoA lyase